MLAPYMTIPEVEEMTVSRVADALSRIVFDAWDPVWRDVTLAEYAVMGARAAPLKLLSVAPAAILGWGRIAQTTLWTSVLHRVLSAAGQAGQPLPSCTAPFSAPWMRWPQRLAAARYAQAASALFPHWSSGSPA